jgi:hypothetical protein
MADATYPLGGQGVYLKQGGKELVVGSTGAITIESGGSISNTGTQTIASGGAIALEDGAQLANPVTTKSTSTGTITNFGITTFGSTSADAYTLADPTRAGLRKTLICTVHGGTTISSVITTASTNVTIISSTHGAGVIRRTITFLSGGQALELVSTSTSAWAVVSNVGTVTLSS